MRALPKSASTTLFLSLLLSLTAHGAFAQTEVNITGVPAAASEGTGAGTTSFVFTVSRSAPGPAVNVTYTIGGDVVAPEDYTALSGTLAFTAAQNSRTITVAIKRDTKFEIGEDLTLTLTGTNLPGVVDVGATFTATTQVLNDDTPPTISIGDRTVAEGALANFAVTLSNGSYLPVSVTATTADGTADGAVTAPFPQADYAGNAPGGTVVNFAANATVLTQNFGVQTINDTVHEGVAPETFFVNLSAASGGSIGVGTGNGVINDNDAVPTVSVSGGAASQAESVLTYAFTVTLTRPSVQPIDVTPVTMDGTASATAGVFPQADYLALPGLAVTFAAGQTSKTVNVTIINDGIDEAAETFSVLLTSLVNVNPGTLSRTGTILDNDAAPLLTITGPTVGEESGPAQFTVTLNAISGLPVQVNWVTDPAVPGTATPGDDYFPTGPGILGWTAGTSGGQTFNVGLLPDALNEADETFAVRLYGNVNAGFTAGGNLANATIVDNDPIPTISIADVAAAEGNAGTTTFGFTVSLSAPSGRTITIRASTADGTATTDFVARTNVPLTFSPLQTSQVFDVTVNGDVVLENDETFAVNLSSPSATVTIADGLGDGTIQNDDSPALSISDATIGETDSGQVSLNFDVSIPDPAPVGGVTFDFDTTDGTATVADNDYDPVVAASGFIPEGDTTVQMTVLVNGDATVEAHETLTATISNADVPGIPGGIVTILDATATGTIVNDDAVPVGALVISEFRLRGPGGVNDEFIEIANRTSEDITVFTTDPLGAGFSVARAGGTKVFDIPNGTLIPARGHFLGVNSSAYSLADYGGTGAAAGDATWTSGIPDDTGLALFATTHQPSYGAATPLDAVGFTTDVAPYVEDPPTLPNPGGLTPIGAGPFANNYSFVRKHQVGPGAALQDTGDSAADFALVAVDAGTYGATTALLGGPSPENLAAEVEQLNSSMPMSGTGNTPSISPAVRSLEFPRTFTNNTGGTVNYLRFKVSSITTIHSPGLVADLRVTDSTTAGSFEGLTLEGMPTDGYSSTTPASGGRNAGVLLNGGLNSTLRLTTALPIAPAGPIDVNFRVEYTLSGQPFLLWVVPEAK